MNLTALVTRLSRTCLSRSSSEYTESTSVADLDPQVDAVERRPLAEHRASPAPSRARRSNDEYSSSIRPASTLDRSRISLSSSSRCLPEPWMSRRYSSWRSLMSPNIRSSSTSEKPSTALSGVRSSCDMLARNSDLCRAGQLQLDALLLELAEQLGVEQGQRRLAREGLEQVERSPRRSRPSACVARPGSPRSGPRAAWARRPATASRRRGGSAGGGRGRPRRGRRPRSGGAPGRRARPGSRRGRSGPSAADPPPPGRSGRRSGP